MFSTYEESKRFVIELFVGKSLEEIQKNNELLKEE